MTPPINDNRGFRLNLRPERTRLREYLRQFALQLNGHFSLVRDIEHRVFDSAC